MYFFLKKGDKNDKNDSTDKKSLQNWWGSWVAIPEYVHFRAFVSISSSDFKRQNRSLENYLFTISNTLERYLSSTHYLLQPDKSLHLTMNYGNPRQPLKTVFNHKNQLICLRDLDRLSQIFISKGSALKSTQFSPHGISRYNYKVWADRSQQHLPSQGYSQTFFVVFVLFCLFF